MTRWNLGLLVALLSVSTFAAKGWVVRKDGIGPVTVGMTLPQLSAALHESFAMPENKEDQGCFYVNSSNHPHAAFMVEDGRLARLDVDAPGIPTEEGIQVGDSERHAVQLYGTRLKVPPHAYTGPQGHYLALRSKSGQYGIRFETDKKKIETSYAGRFDAIQYFEGCG